MSGRTRLPDHVVRFYGNTNFALDTIANRQITFVHVSMLNDPFDPYLYFETNFDEDYNKLLAYVKGFHADHEAWFKNAVPLDYWQKSIENIKELNEDYGRHTFVFSSSAVINLESPIGDP